MQILSTAFQIYQKVEKRWFQAVKPGFSLVELMVYVTLFAVASIGISSLYLMLQKHHVEVNQFGEYEGQKDFAHNLLKVSLKNAVSVSISDVKTNDSACLQLNNEFSTQRVGIKFNGAGRIIESLKQIDITGAQARSISFWVKAEQGAASENVILRWGETSGRQFAVVLRDGKLYIQIEDALLGSYSNNINFFDNKWHHVAITFPNLSTTTAVNGSNLKQYVDGVRRDGNKHEVPWGIIPDYLMRTTSSKLLVGARDKKATNPFTGSISDLRVWNDVISSQDVAKIFNQSQNHDSILTHKLVLKWPMFDLGSSQQTQIIDQSGQNNPGLLHNFSDGDLVAFGNKKQQTSLKFCFFDTDLDNFYELWQGTGNTPQNPTGNNAWAPKTKDVFVPGSNGFFKNVGTSPETVIANFAVGKAAGSDIVVAQKNVTSSFSNNIISSSSALCAVTSDDVFVAPGCTTNQAHATIIEGFDPENDKLTIPAQTKQQIAFLTIYSGINNMPPNIKASWNQLDGTLIFHSTDGKNYPAHIWNRAMRSIKLESNGTFYSINKKIIFSLAEPAFEIDGKFHFYDFVGADMFPYSFNRALGKFQQTEPKMCGLQPYMMTITSQEESNFINSVFKNSNFAGAWIGARETEQGNWRWINGPDNGTRFWSGNGNGYPIIDDGTLDGVVTNLLIYRNPEDHVVNSQDNEMASLWVKNADTKNMRYTNFSLGINGTSVSEFQPKTSVSHSTKPAKYLAINGTPRGGNLWRSATLDTAYCNVSSSVTPPHEKICGHFREWGGMPNDPAVKSASSITIDMEIHNKYCKSTP